MVLLVLLLVLLVPLRLPHIGPAAKEAVSFRSACTASGAGVASVQLSLLRGRLLLAGRILVRPRPTPSYMRSA